MFFLLKTFNLFSTKSCKNVQFWTKIKHVIRFECKLRNDNTQMIFHQVIRNGYLMSSID